MLFYPPCETSKAMIILYAYAFVIILEPRSNIFFSFSIACSLESDLLCKNARGRWHWETLQLSGLCSYPIYNTITRVRLHFIITLVHFIILCTKVSVPCAESIISWKLMFKFSLTLILQVCFCKQEKIRQKNFIFNKLEYYSY